VSVEVVMLAGAIVVGLLALLMSPLVRAVCWDSIVHPRHECVCEKRGGEVRDRKATTDHPAED